MKRALFALMITLTGSQLVANEPVEIEVGRKAPDFEMTGIDGKKFKLSDKLKSGRKNVVLIFSRANW
ncbi:MAG TPA: hypothetical protein DCG12_23100 [Planctomycetaceae bacterium]|nr:hypothetical protein [Planctomycetaceae bacterium]